MSRLTNNQRQQYTKWLNRAFDTAAQFNGSEASLDKLVEALNIMDDFVRAKNNGQSSPDLEREFAHAAIAARENYSDRYVRNRIMANFNI